MSPGSFANSQKKREKEDLKRFRVAFFYPDCTMQCLGMHP